MFIRLRDVTRKRMYIYINYRKYIGQIRGAKM